MHPLIEMANHLIATALAEAGGGGAATALKVRTLAVDEAGLRFVGWLDHPQAEGEVELLLRASPPRGAEGSQQALTLTIVRWPDRLPPALEPLRKVLERARLTLDLDFSS